MVDVLHVVQILQVFDELIQGFLGLGIHGHGVLRQVLQLAADKGIALTFQSLPNRSQIGGCGENLVVFLVGGESSAPASMASHHHIVFAALLGALQDQHCPFDRTSRATQPVAPRELPNLSNRCRTSLAVRLRLSVKVSTNTATPPLP